MSNSNIQESALSPNTGKLLSIVAPAYNEESGLKMFHERLSKTLDDIDMDSEIIYINDGSKDNTINVMKELGQQDDRVVTIDLSRNYGKEIALTAGLDHAKGDAIVVIDTDLQDPPEIIPEFIKHWKEGYDVVYAQRTHRVGESGLKKLTAFLFYRIMQKTGKVQVPVDTGDYRLLSKRALEALNQLREHHRFMKGLFTWIGYPQKAVLYQRDARYSGDTKWNYWDLWNFALEGITSFTIAPLKMATYFGLLTAGFAFLYGVVMIIKTTLFGNPVPGYPSLMVTVLFIGGIQLVAIGIIGEYLGRMFVETKKRPLYFIKDLYKTKTDQQEDPETPSN